MFLYSKSKILKEIIIRIYDDGESLSKTPVIVDENKVCNPAEPIHESIKSILEEFNYAQECIDDIMKTVRKNTKVAKTPFKTVKFSEKDIVKITCIENGEIKEVTGSVYKIIEIPTRNIFRGSKRTERNNIIICLDTSKEFNKSIDEIPLEDIRDIEVISKYNEDPFGDTYPEYEDITPNIVEMSESYTDRINNEEISILDFKDGTFDEEIVINRKTSILLRGNNYCNVANNGFRSHLINNETESIITKDLIIEGEDVDTTIDGFTFLNSSISIDCINGSVIIRNCRFVVTDTDKLKYIIKNTYHAIEFSVKVIIENCLFVVEPNVLTINNNNAVPIFNNNTVIPIFLSCNLADDSSIINNSFYGFNFNKHCIVLYGINDGDTVYISSNYFMYNAESCICLTLFDEPKCKIKCSHNVLSKNGGEKPIILEINPKYADSYKNCEIRLSANTAYGYDLSEKLYLLRDNEEFTFDKDNKPVIYIDDVLEETNPDNTEESPTNPDNGNESTEDTGNNLDVGNTDKTEETPNSNNENEVKNGEEGFIN